MVGPAHGEASLPDSLNPGRELLARALLAPADSHWRTPLRASGQSRAGLLSKASRLALGRTRQGAPDLSTIQVQSRQYSAVALPRLRRNHVSLWSEVTDKYIQSVIGVSGYKIVAYELNYQIARIA